MHLKDVALSKGIRVTAWLIIITVLLKLYVCVVLVNLSVLRMHNLLTCFTGV
jgi:hypothetical protein